MDKSVSLKHLDVTGLFGTFDYKIDFPDDRDYLILTAPNGYGKTTILNIISAVSNGDLFYFLTIPFGKISLFYDEEVRIDIESTYITVDKTFTSEELTEDSESAEDGHAGKVSPKESDKSGLLKFQIATSIGSASFELSDKILRKAIRKLGFYRRLELEDFDIRSKKYLDFLRQHQGAIFSIISNETETPLFFFYLEILQKVKFIESQRLFVKTDDGKWKSQLEAISLDLKRLLEESQKNYLIASQQKDSLFINNVLNARASVTEAKYKAVREKLQKKIETLKQYGLIGEIDIPEFNENFAPMLGCYIRDLDDKLQVFDEILSRINLFMSLSEGKHFTNKRIEISLDGGLRVRASNDGSFIDLDNLSSGEQNELILLYDFIFGLDNDCLLLIDEPEISLHVSWQLKLMKELKKIASLKRLKVIVATHSPQIINSDWNSCFDLYAATRD